jgi:proline racemase
VVRPRLTLETLELHCAGEPLRLLTSELPGIPDAPILERRRWMREHADVIRRVLMYEPRGHRDMYGAILLPPHAEGADLAVLFMHNEGYSTMCGHGTIALGMALLEEGRIEATPPETRLTLEAPAGLIDVAVETRSGAGGPEAGEVRFTNVPSYLAAQDLAIDLDGRALRVDLAFGGAYYGIVEAADLGLTVEPARTEALTRAGARVTELLRRDHTPRHPREPDLGFVYGTIIVERETPRAREWRNVTVFAEAEVDRSPCGSGTSALLAQAAARGWLQPGESILNRSLTGEAFSGRLEGAAGLGDQAAWSTSVAGRAYVTGRSSFVVDERDPLGEGFLLR